MHYYSANPFPEMKGGKQCQKKINILRVLRQGIVTATTGCGPLKLGGVTAKKKRGMGHSGNDAPKLQVP